MRKKSKRIKIVLKEIKSKIKTIVDMINWEYVAIIVIILIGVGVLMQKIL